MKKLSPGNILLYFINILAALLLLGSYLNYFISPVSFEFLAFLSMAVPGLILINSAFCIYWLLKFKKQFLLSFVILAIGWFYLVKFYGLQEKKIIMGSDLKLMSYNVRLFNLYNWSSDTDIPQKIKSFIEKKDPDVLSVQEYATHTELEKSYPFQYINWNSKSHKFGQAIFSKYPIVKKGSLDFEESGNNAIYADIVKNEDTLRIYNVHLESLRLTEEETSLPRENSRAIEEKAKHSFVKQTEQTKLILDHMDQITHKSVVTGDFNNNAFSWVYNQLNQGKNDAFQIAGKGFGKTFDYLFPLRIDFILVDERIKINNFKTFSEKYSDHYPIMARVDF